MNEKEARGNMACHGECDVTLYEQGYLEAIEKAKVLEECLIGIQKQYTGYTGDIDLDIEEALSRLGKTK